MESKRTCPECHLTFESEVPPTGVLVCPLCNCRFSPSSPECLAPTAAASSPGDVSGRQVWRGVLAIGVLLLLAGGLGYAYCLLNGIGHKTASAPASAVKDPPAESAPRPIEIIPVIPVKPMPQPVIRPFRPLAPPPFAITTRPQDLLRPPLRQPRLSERTPSSISKEPQQALTLPERINRAIDHGLAYLRKKHSQHPQYRRYLGLLGLTLLECGAAADDPSVQRIAEWIRGQQRDITRTYELALAILFLDRLGDPRDSTLIRNFGHLLLKGQFDCGAWIYWCPENDPQRLKEYNRHRIIPPQRVVYCGDNSNTQFAILGLWVAQRYGVQARSALLSTEQYFRSTQADDGSWSYDTYSPKNRDSMTCAGLMSLAMRYGVSSSQGRDIRPDHPISIHDAAIHRGLRYLAQSLDKNTISVVGKRIHGVEARYPLYFLWSLERMAVIYDLQKIGAREWYPWAAQMLVETQLRDGRWSGEMGDPVETCFALLILTRSNFTKDLQLAVQNRPSPPMPNLSGSTILQGPEARIGQTEKPKTATPMPIIINRPIPSPPVGPAIIRTPNTPNAK